ncbi:MAG: hypothetical protein A2Y58_03530 [Chloroflexi bacterium RBG_13_51_52]|nr:MAG: hypothetical protein A2Y58_03530 [Chloroflexi bacterium RBG_13_51_52]
MSSKKICSKCRARVEPNWSVSGDEQMCKEAVEWIMIQMFSYGREKEDLVVDVQNKFGVQMKFECPKCKATISS